MKHPLAAKSPLATDRPLAADQPLAAKSSRVAKSPLAAVGPSLLLLLTALIWGSAFVAQRLGMEHVGPFAFLSSRNLLGFLALLPVIAWRRRHLGADPLAGGVRALAVG